ncbi:GNAT family N-acetyltransferase [Clostridium oceanicum]|uniref:GNAT family protein n=1 Tax=Clostridium oceanicum TaxID=1543 RepID=A0ABN1JEP7_9CLOT
MKKNWSKDYIKFSYLKEKDLKLVAKMLKKESVCRYLFFGPNREEETISYFKPIAEEIEKSIKENKLPKNACFTIIEEKTGEFIGQCAVMPIDFCPHNYLIGYQLDDLHWNKGYGTLACEFLINYAFNYLDAKRLTGDCVEDNIGSKKVMIKNGFKKEGIQKNYYLNNKNKNYENRLLLGLLKENISNEKLEEIKSVFK